MAESSIGVSPTVTGFDGHSREGKDTLQESTSSGMSSNRDEPEASNSETNQSLHYYNHTPHQSHHDSELYSSSNYPSYSTHAGTSNRQPSSAGISSTVYPPQPGSSYDNSSNIHSSESQIHESSSYNNSTTTSATAHHPAVVPPDSLHRSSYSPDQSSSVESKSSTAPKRLHISNIPFKYRENDLRQLFYGYGDIVDVEIIFNDRGSKGFGFITLADVDGARRAKEELNGKVVDGRKIEINEATPRTGPPKSKSFRGPWSSPSPSPQSSSWSRSGPYGGNYQYAGYQYPNGGRGGYRGGETSQYPMQGGYGYHQQQHHQQQHNYQDYNHGGYNYQNYGPPSHSPHQSQWSHSDHGYNYSGGYSGVTKSSSQSHDYRYAPY